MKTEIITLNESRNVNLTSYILPTGNEFENINNRPAVLIIPGGGYQMVSDREAEPVAMAYLKAGYHAFILHYSVGADSIWPNPINDYEMAMELIRKKSEEWKIYSGKIAVIGFSAGGHLAGCAATMSKNRPNAAILGYSVLNEASIKTWNPSAPDVVTAIDRNTCPCFVFGSRMDTTVPIESSLQFLTKLDSCGIAFESHIYAYGSHGFATGDSSVVQPGVKTCRRIPNWVGDSIDWLKDMFGDFGNECLLEPECPTKLNGNMDEMLSVDCTMGHLLKHPHGREIIGGILKNAGEKMNTESVSSMTQEQMQLMMMNMPLREMLSYAKVPQELIESINAKLCSIPNKKM